MLTLILQILGLVCFVMSTIGVSSPRANLQSLGLALWLLSLLVIGAH